MSFMGVIATETSFHHFRGRKGLLSRGDDVVRKIF